MAKVENNIGKTKLPQFREDAKVSVKASFNGIDTTLTGYIFSIKQRDENLQRITIYGKTESGDNASAVVYNDDPTLTLIKDAKVANPYADDNFSTPENLAL